MVIPLDGRLPGRSSSLTRGLRADRPSPPLPGTCPPIRPCTGWGLPSRPGHPGRWCALTAPFHPCRGLPRDAAAVCFLWRCPWGHPPWTLSSTLPCGARTFLQSPRGDRRPSGGLWRRHWIIARGGGRCRSGLVVQDAAAPLAGQDLARLAQLVEALRGQRQPTARADAVGADHRDRQPAAALEESRVLSHRVPRDVPGER